MVLCDSVKILIILNNVKFTHSYSTQRVGYPTCIFIT
jgi:hypothetical protein